MNALLGRVSARLGQLTVSRSAASGLSIFSPSSACPTIGFHQSLAIKESVYRHEKEGSSNSHWWLGLMVPAALVIAEERRRRQQAFECFWDKSGSSNNLKRNRINGRVSASDYNANDPIEDRYHCKQLQNIDAYVCAVFDGHGGWALSEYAKSLFINELDFQFEQLKKRKFESEDALIREALSNSFEYIEKSFYEMAVSGKLDKPFNTGSCALITLVKDNKVYTANIGDCKGVVLSEGTKDLLTAQKINHKQNANSKKEQARLKKEFPNDSDIVICKRGGEGACYVKGRLMPTRAFGDFHLKHEKHFKGKGKFNGPYITHKPEIIVTELNSKDRYIVMASDGLWDEMKKDKIAAIATENIKDKAKIVTELFNSALLNAATNAKITVKELGEVPAGQRRRLHDDITVVCIDLNNQFKK